MSTLTKVRQVLLTVKRKTNTIPVVVLAHEVVILQALHGKDVTTIVDLDYDEIEIENDVVAEYERLFRVYGEKVHGIIRSIYPSPQSLADATGIGMVETQIGDVSEDAPQSATIDPRQDARKAAKAKAAKAAKAA